MDASHHLLVVAQLAVAVSAAMNLAAVVSVASQVSAVELFVPPALVVVQQVELVVVAKVESVEQAPVALLVQHW